MDTPIRVFVYGSLKRGGKYHGAYCQGMREPTPARMLGQLYQQSSGYAMLHLPPAHAVALGTNDYHADAAMLENWRRTNQPPAPPPDEDWEWIEGEIFTFDDPYKALIRLDYLEDFTPGRPSLYDRVIAPARRDDDQMFEFTWTYATPAGRLPPGVRRIGTRWLA